MVEPVATFGELIDRYQVEILRYLVRLTGNRTDADDLFQDTFLRAFRAFGRLRRNSNPRAWVYRIATNAYLNHRRGVHRRGEGPLRDDAATWELQAPSEPTLARLALTRAMRRLSRRQRVAFLQRHLEGRSYAEIGHALGCTALTARVHVYQAAQRIRRELTGHEPGTRRAR